MVRAGTISRYKFLITFPFALDLLHARLNSHYEAWSYKKKKNKKITTSGNPFRKNLQIQSVCTF